ncbi:class I SAM-dependent methyltransferase [Glycomyces halotolerans]
MPIHAESEYYDQDGFREGRDEIRDFEAAEVGDVTGKRLLHLQCHMGQDTLSWARRGATRVVGLDFSEPAVAVARNLAAELGLGPERAEFVVSDVYRAAGAVPDADYDIVYTSIGVLDWLPDVQRWAEVAASLVAPGGFLYIAEFHPFLHALDWETGTRVVDDYFSAEPYIAEEPGTYAADAPHTVHNRSFERKHTLGDIVSAVAAAGLRIEFLHEFERTVFQSFGADRRGADGCLRSVEGRPELPRMFSLKASRT